MHRVFFFSDKSPRLADIDNDGLAHSDDDLNIEQLLEKYSFISNTSTHDSDNIPEEEQPKNEEPTSSLRRR